MAISYQKDAYNIGLLYSYIYSSGMQRMVSLNNLNAFYNQIEINLESLSAEKYGCIIDKNDDEIYFISSNEEGEIYYILDPAFNLEKIISTYFGCLSTKYLIASQMNNALSCLGLIKVNANIISIRKYVNELLQKSELTEEEKEILNNLTEKNSNHEIVLK